MEFAAFSFVVVFLLIASGGLLLFYRQAMVQRISSVVAARPQRGDLLNTLQQTGSSLGEMVERLDRVLPKSEAEVSITEKRLIRAGYREETAVKMFYGAKVLVPILFCLVAAVSGLAN